MKNRIAILITAATVAIFTLALLAFSFNIALAAFAGSLFVVMVFFRPFWGLLLYIAMTYLRPQEFVGALRGQPIMLVMAVVIIGILLVHKTLRKEPFPAFRMPQTLIMVIFLALIPLSHLQIFYLTAAKDSFMAFLPIFMFFFMLVSLVENISQLKTAYTFLFFITLFLAVNGIYQYYHGSDIAGQTMIQGRIRWIGIFEDPNDLGLTILVFTPFALVNGFSRSTNILKRALWMLAFLVLVYALYLTDSRGTFLGLIAVLGYFFVKRFGKLRGAILGTILLVMALIAGPGRFSEISTEEASASGRLDAWATGLSLFFWRPALGVGFGNFTEFHHLTAHNSVVLCMAELGLPGIFVWMLLMVKSFRDTLIIERAAPPGRMTIYLETMQMAIVGFLVSAFFLSRTYNAVYYIVIALSALTAYMMSREFDIRLPFISRKTLLMTLILIAALILLIKFLVVI
ncbi:MAG: hypothetical protein GF417_00765 [Candidatus Latescibacteria bacterium]|nr:hypothetical protein [bacterium]MBD3422958.1 hypothetical protein [Candidatus Latescibacterota bacterium]